MNTTSNNKSFTPRARAKQKLRIDDLVPLLPISDIGRRILWNFDLKLDASQYYHTMTPSEKLRFDIEALDVILKIVDLYNKHCNHDSIDYELHKPSAEDIKAQQERDCLHRFSRRRKCTCREREGGREDQA